MHTILYAFLFQFLFIYLHFYTNLFIYIHIHTYIFTPSFLHTQYTELIHIVTHTLVRLIIYDTDIYKKISLIPIPIQTLKIQRNV